MADGAAREDARVAVYSRWMSAVAYYLTWNTYGTWLPGDRRGSIAHGGNRYGDPCFPSNDGLEEHVRDGMKQEPLVLTVEMRRHLTDAIEELCDYRGWNLRALNVRTNHAHAVVSARAAPERVLAQFKARGTRRLREAGLVSSERKVWAEHGSTRYIWENESIEPAVQYVEEMQ